MRIIVLAVGSVKETYFREAAEEYLKRLKPYAKVETIELTHEKFRAGFESQAKKREREKLSDAIKKILGKFPDAEVFLLTENGREYSSLEFARALDKNSGTAVFVVGGALGFEPDFIKEFRNTLSLGRMTFPHELARVVLLEQIYRAVTISRGKAYHY